MAGRGFFAALRMTAGDRVVGSMIDEQSGEKDDQPHRKWGRGQNLLLVLLIVVVMVAGVIYSLWDEIFPARSVPRVTPTVAPSPTIDARVAGLHLPAGFHISIFEAGLNMPRFMRSEEHTSELQSQSNL